MNGVADTTTQQILGLVYDIMAFASQRYRGQADSRRTIKAARILIVNDIDTKSLEYPKYGGITDVLRAIASTSSDSETESEPELSGIDTDDEIPLDNVEDEKSSQDTVTQHRRKRERHEDTHTYRQDRAQR